MKFTPLSRDTVVDSCGDEEMLFMDGFDAAIVGYSDARPDGTPSLPIYDYWAMVDILTTEVEGEEEDGAMGFDDAVDYLEFNVTSAWIGERTPIILNRPPYYDEP